MKSEMDMSIAKEMIRVIREERDRRLAVLETEDDPRSMYGGDEPLINELCLMLLVTIRHQIEREMVLFAARITSAGKELGDTEYEALIKKERKEVKEKKGWGDLYAKLECDAKTECWLETLRLLSNIYKHDLWLYPDEDILTHLHLKPGNYLPIYQSQAFIDGLAKSLELSSDADYSDIAEAFVIRVSVLFSTLGAKLGHRFYIVQGFGV
jgi:hypothetical protein